MKQHVWVYMSMHVSIIGGHSRHRMDRFLHLLWPFRSIHDWNCQPFAWGCKKITISGVPTTLYTSSGANSSTYGSCSSCAMKHQPRFQGTWPPGSSQRFLRGTWNCGNWSRHFMIWGFVLQIEFLDDHGVVYYITILYTINYSDWVT